jgi:hypothetical protein
LQTTSAEPTVPLATSTPKQQKSYGGDDAVFDASTIQLNASVTEREESEDENFEAESSPLRDMSSEWSLTTNSSWEEEEEVSVNDRGARRRLDMSLLSSSDEESTDSDMEFLLTREQRFMRDFVDLVSFNYQYICYFKFVYSENLIRTPYSLLVGGGGKKNKSRSLHIATYFSRHLVWRIF